MKDVLSSGKYDFKASRFLQASVRPSCSQTPDQEEGSAFLILYFIKATWLHLFSECGLRSNAVLGGGRELLQQQNSFWI